MDKVTDKVTDEKLEKYFSVTKRALAKVKIRLAAGSEEEKQAKVILDMAQRYFEDARHFSKKGDKVTAFAALNYAHGWLDAGAMLGLFDVGRDSELFTVE